MSQLIEKMGGTRGSCRVSICLALQRVWKWMVMDVQLSAGGPSVYFSPSESEPANISTALILFLGPAGLLVDT